MKNLKFFLTMLAIVITSIVNAQDWEGKTYKFGQLYPGYIIKLNGDTLRGFVEQQERQASENKCFFYTDPNNKKSKVAYKPDDLKGYAVGDKTYRSIRYSGGLSGKTLKFNLLIKDGHIAQYMFYFIENELDFGRPNEDKYAYDKRINVEQKIYQKGDEQPFNHDKFALKWGKVMAELISDNKEIADKVIAKKEGYTMLHHYDIIDEYNAWYSKNHQ